ncbi:MAG: GNAT family protein [Gaiellaceae bacterium]
MRRSTPAMTLLAAEGYCGVQGIRFANDAAARLAEVRTFMAETGATIGSWWLCERSTPHDLEARLFELGLTAVTGDYLVDGMLLTHEPPPGPRDVEARRPRTVDEYVAARELQYDVFRSPAAHRRDRDELAAEFSDPARSRSVFAAWIDGRLAGVGRAFFAPGGAILAGGATAEWARGRGAYRALVRARWDDVVARDGRALVVQAGSLSAPILGRLGFEKVLRFRRLEDVPSSG